MPEQCDNINREMHGRDARQHGRNRSPQLRRSHAMEIDDSRNAPAPRARVTESNAPGSWRGPDAPLMSINTIDIAALILPNWEIEGTTNLLLHMHGCQDCLRFIEHVRQNLQGGALSIYLERQKKHWRQVLHDEMREEIDEAYKDGLKDGEKDIETLEDKLDYFHRRVQSLEAENDELRKKITELSRINDDLRGRGHVVGGPLRGEGP
jgi:hypothetical protein